MSVTYSEYHLTGKEVRALGLTREERDAFDLLTKAAEAITGLPKLHPSELKEVEHEIHVIQMRLLARPQLRKIGWGREYLR